MRNKTIPVLALLLLSGCGERSSSGGFACWLPIHAKPMTATVRVDEAQFVFPTGDFREVWQWNLDGPPPIINNSRIMRQDYSWSIRAGDAYFGFSHYENANTRTGSFNELIADGDLQDFRVVSQSPFVTTKLQGLTVEQSKCGNVTVKITGKDNVDAIFSSHPQTVDFTVPAGIRGVMGQVYDYKPVPVHYVN